MYSPLCGVWKPTGPPTHSNKHNKHFCTWNNLPSLHQPSLAISWYFAIGSCWRAKAPKRQTSGFLCSLLPEATKTHPAPVRDTDTDSDSAHLKSWILFGKLVFPPHLTHYFSAPPAKRLKRERRAVIDREKVMAGLEVSKEASRVGKSWWTQ